MSSRSTLAAAIGFVCLLVLAAGWTSPAQAGRPTPRTNVAAPADGVCPSGTDDASYDAQAKGGVGVDGDGDERTLCVCHHPPGNPQNAHTICIGVSAVCAHLKHGDDMGPCPEPCGGPEGLECDEGQFCQRPLGECAPDAFGVCEVAPAVCPVDFLPVCGCDEHTYANACFAAGAGVTVAHEGACEDAVACGGAAGETCEATQYCRRPLGECAAETEGLCVTLPTNCPISIEPVCGCDGLTYDNACLAAAAGVTVATEGACATPVACGGAAGDTCTEGQFCQRETGLCTEDTEGVCAYPPATCPTAIVPVCGCDGLTYDSACLAAAARVNVAAEGACVEPVICGGEAGATCAEAEYCSTATGVCEAGAEGVCALMPSSCDVTVVAVCGCDGLTYDNVCLAAAAGVNVAAEGACTSPQRMSHRHRR